MGINYFKPTPVADGHPDMENEKSQGDSSSYGYHLYPEREGKKYIPDLTGVILRGEGKEQFDKYRCEQNVYSCVKNSPLIKLLMGALKASGCEIDIRRHISCEVCDPAVNGGFDPIMNQVIVCQNTAQSEGIVQGVLTHEMIHMFDYCENELDFKNLDHLACTEIRAANLAHCSFLSAWQMGEASPINVCKMHQNCVKTKALQSVLSTRRVTIEAAVRAIDRVFDRCYNDLEPIGRRIRRNSADMHKAYLEGEYYGYT